MNTTSTPMLFPIEPDEFWKKIQQLIRAELAKKNEKQVEYTTPGFVQKPLYKAFEVCEMLNVSRQTLHAWAKEGLLRPYKIKSRVFYLWSDIEKLLNL